MERVVIPPEDPKEGSCYEDALTGNIMFYRFGKWKEISKENYEEHVKPREV